MVLVTDGISDPLDTGARALPAAGGLSDTERMERWEPWVRAETCRQELLSRVYMNIASGGGFALWHLEKDALGFGSNPLTGHAFPVVEMIAPPQAVFDQQIPLVLAWQELRAERLSEILGQIDPQYDLWASVACLHPTRTPRTLELINIALQFTVGVEMRFKHVFGTWRPYELNAQVQPVLTTPGHGSFPSGHATQAFMVARLLQRFLRPANPNIPGLPDNHPAVIQLFRQAARIATNRVVAGVHYPVDSIAGRLLGVAIADYFVASCMPGTNWTPRRFDGSMIATPAGSLDLHPEIQPLDGGPQAAYYSQLGPTAIPAPNASPLMAALWDRAQSEWNRFNF